MTTIPRWASNALQLSGNAYADCGNPPILGGLESYTLEAWVNQTNAAGNQSVIGKINLGVDAEYQLYIENGYVVAYYNTAPWVIMAPSPLTVTVDNWHHLATTYDRVSGTLTLYIDGVQVAQGSFPFTPSTSAADVMIGATLLNGSPDWFLQGMIGEVMIWNVCRSAEDISNDSVQISYQGDTSVPSLLVDLDFSIFPASDWAGNDIQLTLSPGANYCIFVPGLYLQGNAYADCGNNPDLSMGLTNPYTIEGWFCLTGPLAGGGVLVSKINTNVAGEYSVTFSASGAVISTRSGQSGQPFSLSSNPCVEQNIYYHFATSYDEHTNLLSIYLNGNLQAAQYAPPMTSAPSVDLLIGASLVGGTPGGFFQGYIQNVRIWNTCLEQGVIKQWMYNQPVSEPNLVASFDFTVIPPVDTTGQHAIQLLNGAVISAQMLTIAPDSVEATLGFIQSINADYFSQNTVAPNPPPTVSLAASAQKLSTPFTEEFKTGIWKDLETRTLGEADDETKQRTRNRFEEAYARAAELTRKNPDLLKVFTIKEENGLVKIVHHGIKGDTLVFEAPKDAVDPCTLWWIQFVFQLTAGFLQALGLAPSFGNIATRVYNLLSGNARVVAAFNTVIGKTITVSAGMTVVGTVIAEGYMWAILKMAFTAAGWWTLVWILKKVIALATGLEAAELLAGFIVWAAQLTIQSLNFNSSCPHTVIEAGKALPLQATA